jgi:hypothetical protein
VRARAALVSGLDSLAPCADSAWLPKIAGHDGAGGECERGVRLGGAAEHVVEQSPVHEQFLSERIGVRAGAGSRWLPTGR